MARHLTDFGTDTAGSAPVGWTEAQDAAFAKATVRADAWGLSGQVLRLEPRNYIGGSDAIKYSLVWTGIGSISGPTQEAGRIKVHVWAYDGQTFGLVRAQNSANGSSYQCGIDGFGTRQLRRHTGNLAHTVLDSGAGGLSVDTPYGYRLSVDAGGMVEFKLWTWDDGEADYGESTAATYDATDGAPLAAGYAGVGFNGATPYSADNPFANPYHWVEYDRVGVGTAGDTAPLDWGFLPPSPLVTVSEIRRTTSRIGAGAFVAASGGSAVHAATQVRVRRVSTSGIEYGPVSLPLGSASIIATGLPEGPTGPQGQPVDDADLIAEARHQDGDGLWSAWGASEPFQTLNLWESGEYVTHVDVRVEIISEGTGVMQSLRDFFGHNWIKDATVSASGVDQTIGTARVSLHRQVGALSLAPLMTGSALNQDGETYAPALDFGREFEIYTCILPPGVEPESGDWEWKFAGVADDPEWPGKSGDVQLSARDYLGPLSDAIIRNETEYGDEDTPPDALVAMQAILDDRMGDGQYTVYDLTVGAGFAVRKYPVRDISALEAIENLAQQWGGKSIRQEWNPVDEEWQVAVIEPDREKTEPDYSISPETYLDVHTLRTDNRNLRTLVIGHAEDETGKILTSQLPAEEDVATDPLILLYGERPLIFSEEAAKGVNTQAQLDAMVGGIYPDVSNPPLPMEPETKYCPFAKVGDLVRWKANALLFDEDQDSAVLLLTHTFPSAGVGRTRWKCGGKPKGAYAGYRNLGVEVRGIGRRPAIFNLNLTHSPLGVLNATIIPGADTVRWRVYDKIGGAPDVDALYYQGEYLRTVRTASWSVGNGTHHVLVQGFSDRGTYVEARDSIVITGVPGEGGGGGGITLSPGTPFLRPGPDFLPDEPTLEADWTNTSDTLDVRAVYYMDGVADLTVNLSPGATDDIGSYHAPDGSRVKVGLSYYAGAVEGPRSYSAEIVLGEEL